MRFRRKPVEIEATQWFVHGDHKRVGEVPPRAGTKDFLLKKFGWLNTSMGGHRVSPGDWIIRDAKGEFSSCNPITFQRLYEEIYDYDEKDLPRNRQRDRSA